MCAWLIVRQNQPLEVLAELQHPRHELRRIVCRLLGRTGKVLTPQDNAVVHPVSDAQDVMPPPANISSASHLIPSPLNFYARGGMVHGKNAMYQPLTG